MTKMNFDFSGKVYFVTGGGRGIGRSICEYLGECGAHVGLTYTGSPESEKRAQEVCAKIESSGGKAQAFKLDINNVEQISQTIDSFVKPLGRLDGLVNNAGISIDGLAMRFKADDWDKVLDTNLKGAFLVTQACLRYLMKAGGASVVNVGSVVGLMGNAGQAAYSASKSGLIGMTKSLARELGSRKLRVNVIAPGYISTDMTATLSEDQKTKLLTNLPLETLGQPEDIAWATAFLLSDQSRYITGQVLNVNGGLYM